MPLPAYGSVEDRVMREMVFRERQEKVAHLDAIAKMISRVFNVDTGKAFGHVLAEYSAEVFQETYDVELMARKAAALREAQQRIQAKRKHDQRMLTRLDKMGEYYDKEFGANFKVPPKR